MIDPNAANTMAPNDLPALLNSGSHQHDAAAVSTRLSASRQRLREVLHGGGSHRGAQTDVAVSDSGGQHPLMLVAQVAARHSLDVVADRYPLRMVGVAMAAGGLLVWGRPWRWLLRPGVIAGLAARLVTSLPLERVLATLLAAPTTHSGKHAS